MIQEKSTLVWNFLYRFKKKALYRRPSQMWSRHGAMYYFRLVYSISTGCRYREHHLVTKQEHFREALFYRLEFNVSGRFYTDNHFRRCYARNLKPREFFFVEGGDLTVAFNSAIGCNDECVLSRETPGTY